MTAAPARPPTIEMSMSSMFSVSLLRKNARMMPRPTAASAAATATTKMANTWPTASWSW